MALDHEPAWTAAFSFAIRAHELVTNDSNAQKNPRKIKAISNNLQVANAQVQYAHAIPAAGIICSSIDWFNKVGSVRGYQLVPFPACCILAIYSTAHVRTYLEHLQFPDSVLDEDVAESFRRGIFCLDLALRLITPHADAVGYCLIQLHKARAYLQLSALKNDSTNVADAIGCFEKALSGLSVVPPANLPKQLEACRKDLYDLLAVTDIPGRTASPAALAIKPSDHLSDLQNIQYDPYNSALVKQFPSHSSF